MKLSDLQREILRRVDEEKPSFVNLDSPAPRRREYVRTFCDLVTDGYIRRHVEGGVTIYLLTREGRSALVAERVAREE